MSRVFVAGSRKVSRLNKEIAHRLDNIVESGLTILIGDANGADKAVQRYLANKGYRNVIVYCVAGECRNNIGSWTVRTVAPRQGSRRDFSFYSAKDRVMVDETDYGLMLWDGESRGTLTSIVDLLQQSKPVVVYVAPRGATTTLHGKVDLAALVGYVSGDALKRAEHDLHSARQGGGTDVGRSIDNGVLF